MRMALDNSSGAGAYSMVGKFWRVKDALTSGGVDGEYGYFYCSGLSMGGYPVGTRISILPYSISVMMEVEFTNVAALRRTTRSVWDRAVGKVQHQIGGIV